MITIEMQDIFAMAGSAIAVLIIAYFLNRYLNK